MAKLFMLVHRWLLYPTISQIPMVYPPKKPITNFFPHCSCWKIPVFLVSITSSTRSYPQKIRFVVIIHNDLPMISPRSPHDLPMISQKTRHFSVPRLGFHSAHARAHRLPPAPELRGVHWARGVLRGKPAAVALRTTDDQFPAEFLQG